MTPCLVSTGFFVLGRCGRPAVAACGRCGRPICDRHDAGGLCPECATAQGYGSPYDPFWTSGYRTGYYHFSSTSYSDPTWYGTFDDYDRGAFDPDDQGDFGEGDFDYGGDDFVDS
ncbi:hypothetical protein [Nonomuraea sediminis]|uniref:hypothetical protein n=1 Tax=Nonomuraea sediminis TaxID=2835864 RepID=UPI0027E0692C|nr:hypothetical protein [Nonomuraea sediminis]